MKTRHLRACLIGHLTGHPISFMTVLIGRAHSLLMLQDSNLSPGEEHVAVLAAQVVLWGKTKCETTHREGNTRQ